MATRRSTLAGIAVLALAAVHPAVPPVRAQPVARTARIGVLLFGTPAAEPNLTAFIAGLRDLGYVEGRNVVIDYGSAEGRPERFREVAARIVALKPDVIAVLGGDLVPAAKAATTTAPIVMLTSYDPVEAGIVASFAHPGGNLTGVAFVAADTGAKRLQFLKEAAPSVSRIAVLWSPDHPDGEIRDIEAAAPRLGAAIESLEIRRPEDLDIAFERARRSRSEALMVVSSRLLNLNRSRIVEFAGSQRMILVSGWGSWAKAGGLLSYGPDLDALARRAATYVDKILKGGRPGDLAVEQPTRFELVINMKRAAELGLTIPPSLLARADQLIE